MATLAATGYGFTFLIIFFIFTMRSTLDINAILEAIFLLYFVMVIYIDHNLNPIM